MKLFKFKLLALLLVIPFTIMANEPEYKKWESHDVKGLYIEIEDEDDADLEEYGRYFQRYCRLSSGTYNIEVCEKVSSKVWQIKGTKFYILFRFNPFLYKFDEGVLEWTGSNATFYKKP